MKRLTFLLLSNSGTPIVKKLKSGAVLVGLAWALGVTLAACAVMCSWVVLTAGPVYDFGAFIAAGSVIGAILGGATCGKTAGTLGLLHGFLTGWIYGLILAVLPVTGSAEFFAAGLVIRPVLLGIAGAIGGIAGVNLYYNLRHKAGNRPRRKFSN